MGDIWEKKTDKRKKKSTKHEELVIECREEAGPRALPSGIHQCSTHTQWSFNTEKVAIWTSFRRMNTNSDT